MVEAFRTPKGLWSFVPWEIVSLLVALAIALAAPVDGFETRLRAVQLELAGSSSPPSSAAVVLVEPGPDCGQMIAQLTRERGAREFVLVSPVDVICPGSSEQSAHVTVVSPASLYQANGGIFGVRPNTSLADVVPSGWVAPHDSRAVPTLRLERLADVGTEFFTGRLIVVGLDQVSTAFTPEKIAGALAAAKERGARSLLPSEAAFFVLGVLAILGAHATRWGRHLPVGRTGRGGAVAGSLAIFLILALASQLGAFGVGFLFPLVRAGLCLSIAGVLSESRNVLLERRARFQATVLLEEAYRRKTAGLSQESDAAFWARLASRAAQAHPADEVLVAELPPFRWHLKIWAHGSVDESIIKERRRDIRRGPYSDDRGVPTTSLTRGYLCVKDWSAVLVPMIAEQDVEGYLMLLGPRAEAEYKRAPERADRVAGELAALAHRRRLALSGRSAAAEEPEQLLEKTRGMLEELGLMTALFENAPVGLLYADSFGDVRLMGREIAGLLSGLGVDVPPSTDSGLLESGALPLSRILHAFSRDKNLGDLSQGEMRLDAEYHGGTVRLVAKAIYGKDGGLNGYVASAAPVQEVQMVGGAEITQLPASRRDPLAVFSMTELMGDLLGEAEAMGETGVRLQTPRTHGTVVAHRESVRRALREFVLDVSARTVESRAVITIDDADGSVELKFLDVQLGVPAGAVRRALATPSIPPPGLGAVGQLAKSIEDSHGRVRVESDVDWGTTVTIEFVRARPRVEAERRSTGDAPRAKTLEFVRK